MQFIENIEKKGTQTTIDDLIEIENKIDVLMEYLLGFTMTNEYDVVFTVTENHIEFDICLEDSGYDEKNYFFEIISNIFEKNNRWLIEKPNEHEVIYTYIYSETIFNFICSKKNRT